MVVLLKGYVGPFFYINSKIYARLESVREFDEALPFFDSSLSHIRMFDTLYIPGDYGNYPRARVILDNAKKKFIVYMDKSLMNDEIKQQIKNMYELNGEKVVFKTDSHYTHDDLGIC